MDECKSLSRSERLEIEALARYIALKADRRKISMYTTEDGRCEVTVEVGDIDDDIRFAGAVVDCTAGEARWYEC